MNILCYGDSNTFGYIPGSGGERYPRDVRWTGRLQSLLGESYYVIEEGLGGRTTVWDDPIEEHKNGKAYLLPCLESHQPLDLVVIMLGTNDSKARFSLPACDIAEGMENLVRTILKSEAGRDHRPPDVLLLSPLRIGKLTDWQEMLAGAQEKMEQLHELYGRIAAKYGIGFLDAGTVTPPCDLDGVHLDERGHGLLAQRLYEAIVKKYAKS